MGSLMGLLMGSLSGSLMGWYETPARDIRLVQHTYKAYKAGMRYLQGV